jgi:hypothetical protein
MHSKFNIRILPNIIRMIKSRRIKLVGDVTHMEDKRNAFGIMVAELEGEKRI